MRHKDFGKVEIVATIPKRWSVVEVKVLQRGKGWCEMTKTYRPVKRVVWNGDGSRTIYRDLTRRDEYGHREVVKLKDLHDAPTL